MPIDFDKINADKAIAACITAVKKFPKVSRFASQLGRAYLAKKDLLNAELYYQRAADLGSRFALVELSHKYSTNGNWDWRARKDDVKAARLLAKAADRGDPSAIAALGQMYEGGLGVKKDLSKAIFLYKIAAEKGDPIAITYLITMRDVGYGVQRDNKTALHLEQSSAEKPTLVVNLGDWSVYKVVTSTGPVCYALSTPKEQQPQDFKRGVSLVFVSNRPEQHVKNEISFVLGMDLGNWRKSSVGLNDIATVNGQSFQLAPLGHELWLKGRAFDSQFLERMRNGIELSVKGLSANNESFRDIYSLSGFAQALKSADDLCGIK
jgi:tetratricopeptide (TPR) repeat protein